MAGQGGDGSNRGGAIVFGVALALFGAFVAYAGYRDYEYGGPFLPGLAVAIVGVVLLVAGIRFPAVDVLRVFGGVVAAIAGVGCVVVGLVAGVVGGPRYLPIVPMGFMWLVGAAVCFDLPGRLAARGRRRADDVSRLLGGAAAISAGLAIAGQVATDGVSKGVPPWAGVAAGGVFFLAGVLIVASGRGGLAGALTLAVFLSLFAALSLALFPPGGLVVAFVAVQAWIAVYRKLHEWVTGSDPLAGTSDERLLGLGCLVYLALVLLVVAASS